MRTCFISSYSTLSLYFTENQDVHPKKHGGQEEAIKFISEDYLNHEDRFNLLSDFGMYAEAASAAFASKNIEALKSLEEHCIGKDDILKTISNYKSKLIGAAASSSWRN